ncbi:MAG: hypothetical protein J2P37_31225 [Ktedonobacteraceae bacterium]|nr:hypothetical protein [Ktedonobacteraceae bacterium]
MAVLREERDRVLRMLEEGQINAGQAAELLDALDIEQELVPERPKHRERIIRVRATKLNERSQKAQVLAAVPFQVIKTGLSLGMNLLPQLDSEALRDLMRSIERGSTGRLLDLQDLERGERLEIFVE